MGEAERDAALELLRAPDLLGRILADLDAGGMVGEATNKLTAYLAATSRKLDRPLAVVVQSSSAAGKSALMDAVLAMMPPEEMVRKASGPLTAGLAETGWSGVEKALANSGHSSEIATAGWF